MAGAAAYHSGTEMLYANPYAPAFAPGQLVSLEDTSSLTLLAERASRHASAPNAAIGSPRSANGGSRVEELHNSSSSADNTPQVPLALFAESDLSLAMAPNTAVKAKRVRTGCLTCRQRHLKCDEATPVCQNCTKSNRPCKRGVRLNFIDTTVRQPPQMMPSRNWEVSFQDESRHIASEYVGGTERYSAVNASNSTNGGTTDAERLYTVQDGLLIDYSASAQHIPSIHAMTNPFQNIRMFQGAWYPQEAVLRYSTAQRDNAYPTSRPPVQTLQANQLPVTVNSMTNTVVISNLKELNYMRAFVEEVAPWMDALDPDKHFTELLPHRALASPMILNALFSCGAGQVNGVDISDSTAAQDAFQYYNTATSYLLQTLQSPLSERDRDTCATAASLLNVYEIMSERQTAHMNHVKGARALIRQCGWDATATTKVGKSCFWMNVGLEVMRCLREMISGGKRKVEWDPETWGLDLHITDSTRVIADEVWTQRILYAVAKITNFRASDGDKPLASRIAEWNQLDDLLNAWHAHLPLTMQPLASIPASGDSLFPTIWITKRTAVMAKLLYHSARILLATSYPDRALRIKMHNSAVTHAKTILGISNSNDESAVPGVVVRAIGIATDVLTDPRYQAEVLRILERVGKKAGWNVKSILTELPKKWVEVTKDAGLGVGSRKSSRQQEMLWPGEDVDGGVVSGMIPGRRGSSEVRRMVSQGGTLGEGMGMGLSTSSASWVGGFGYPGVMNLGTRPGDVPHGGTYYAS